MKSCKDYVYMATLVGGRALERTQRTHGDIPENIEIRSGDVDIISDLAWQKRSLMDLNVTRNMAPGTLVFIQLMLI
ncbi:MAG: hypothetical protein WA364_14580 [Candidatus Nitrosopolaris sp.]